MCYRFMSAAPTLVMCVQLSVHVSYVRVVVCMSFFFELSTGTDISTLAFDLVANIVGSMCS